MINLKLRLVVATTLFFTACGSSVKPSEFKNFVEEEKNGFVQKTDIEELSIKCMYTPAEYLTVLSYRSDNITESQFKKTEAELDMFDLYRLEISTPDSRKLSGLSEYFSFYMQEDISKVCAQDSMPCIIYHAEPFSSIEGKQRIEIGFEKSACMQEQIVLKNAPFSPSPIIFIFNKETLTTPPIALK